MALAATVGLLALTSGCARGPLELSSPRVDGPEASSCRRLLAGLPAKVADQPRRRADVPVGYAAAWGDPAIELRCGVGRPAAFTRTALCQQTDGVGWFVPPDQLSGSPARIVMTTIGRSPRVSVTIPAAYFPPAATMVDLAGSVRRSLVLRRPCH